MYAAGSLPVASIRRDRPTPTHHHPNTMRSAGAALLLLALASGAWGFVPTARLAPARAVAARRQLRMDAGEGAPPKLAKIENIKVRDVTCVWGWDGGAAAAAAVGGRASDGGAHGEWVVWGDGG